jgi:hypothetical protein
MGPNSANCSAVGGGASCKIDFYPEYTNVYSRRTAGVGGSIGFNVDTELIDGSKQNFYVLEDGGELEEWTISVNYTLPANFKTWANNAITLEYFAEDDVELEVEINGISKTGADRSGSWVSLGFSATDLGSLNLSANSTMAIDIRMANDLDSDGVGGLVKVGRLSFNYSP